MNPADWSGVPVSSEKNEEGESGLLSAGGIMLTGLAGRHPGDEPHTREQVGRRQLGGGVPPICVPFPLCVCVSLR